MSKTDASSTQFTIGKIDAGLAILLSPDNYVVEFPSSILPETAEVGSIVNITVERNLEAEKHERREFDSLQYEIFEEFSIAPKEPEIIVKRATQSDCIIEWAELILHNAKLKRIDVYRDGLKLNTRPNELKRQVKVTGLQMEQKYEFYIVLVTSAGSYKSNTVQMTALSMENLTGIYPAFGAFQNEADIDILQELLTRVGAQWSEDLSHENTHLVCTLPKGPKFEKATELNIPIVTPEFLKACESSKRIQPAHTFYIKS